ncbi:unnamed protein product [Mytilus edulis]|uniref:G-protein coupled receptors family 1 profile domain-containing protein n=1 Tax=Mytilus edulis TaxID=6550 RepID=A0A8S3Q7N9_MYTED|nr:unnamed protein product [Mytilus edulis]
MNFTDQDWSYKEVFDGDSNLPPVTYTWPITGILASAWCPGSIRLPINNCKKMLDFLDEVSSNSSSDFMFEGTFDVNTDSEYDELAAANRTSPSPRFYEDMNDKYCLSMFPTYYHTIAYIGMSILFTAMVSGIVQRYASSRLTKSASQKSQSRIASIVIILYFTLYCPLQIVVIVLQFTCEGQNYLGPISFTISMAHFALSALNPIMLCLRVPEAKKALKDRLCRCINK